MLSTKELSKSNSFVLPQASSNVITVWLLIICVLIATMVVFGGYVRLTRSGLSMVEWHVVTGVIPPLNEQDWQETFAKYQQSPEYLKVNVGMSLADYKFIYYMEYLHRLLGRITGLLLVIPMAIFFLNGTIPREKSKTYIILALLFGAQGFMGWCMVKSGLVDQPHVSHYRLTSHLFLALILLGFCFWVVLDNMFGDAKLKKATSRSLWKWLVIAMVILLIQIAYGGFVAGLKAGHVSYTFPLMMGSLIPAGMFNSVRDVIDNSVTVHFIHRWFAFVVPIVAGVLYYVAKKGNYSEDVEKSALGLIVIIIIQILFGLGVILFGVPISIALIHQGFALVLFLALIFIGHRLALNS